MAAEFNRELDDIDNALIAALLTGMSASAASAAVNISTTTYYRRTSKPRFKTALSEARAGLWVPDAEKLRAAVSGSIDRLIAIRDDPQVAPATQAKVSKDIIELAAQLHELVDLHPRLAALEAALHEREENRSTSV